MRQQRVFLNARQQGSVLFILLSFLSGCSGVSGPYTPAQVLTPVAHVRIGLPAYAFKPSSRYALLTPIYYFTDLGDDAWLTLYFAENNGKNSLSKLRISLYALAVTQEQRPQKVRVNWADQGIGMTCKPDPDNFRTDMVMPKLPYQTCIEWRIGYQQMVIYSGLPLTETIDLVNSPEELK